MKFEIEDQYPEHWISGNEPEPPLPGCERVPWKITNERFEMEGADWYLEIESIEHLLQLGEKKECNIFIDVAGRRIVFTKNLGPD